ncbi:putative membrane protein [Pseudoxanthomonas sp. GM95]|uniref:bestrophin family protein n=1 Tax=Pseudoxanthomonas sp. GM95 TaxID=1881043 RepID=UPI0008B67BB8|nr:bestrophin family ion channel [Pseudoxanthomonas sp. GM95]SEM40310.1 putative membrane protein [Pseudoxanthomonas sp. GM95]
MIIADRFPLRRIWPRTYKRLLVLLAFDCAVAVLYTFAGWDWLSLEAVPLAQLGSALAIFLAFRANAAYGRWWEARQLWGSLVNTSRAIARQAMTALDVDPADPRQLALRDDIVVHQVAFVHALRCHLRKQNPFPELTGLLGEARADGLRGYANVPNVLTLQIGSLLQDARALGMIDSMRWTALDTSLTTLANIQGACERIKNTPLPRQFSSLPRALVNLYCWLVPLGLVGGMGLAMPIASVMISFTLIAVDSAASGIEDPFENTVNDTPMTALSRGIELTLREMLGQRVPLRNVQAIDGFIY